MVKPWAAPLSINYRDGTPSVRYSRRPKRHGEESPLKGLAFVVRDARRAASWTGLMQFQSGAGNALLQFRKLPTSTPRAESARICRGLDMASFYLWLRSDERRGNDPARRCHSKSSEKHRWSRRRGCARLH